jgi:hypothetical protein
MWANLCGVLSGSTYPNVGWLAGQNAAWNQGNNDRHLSTAGYNQFAWFTAQVLMQ